MAPNESRTAGHEESGQRSTPILEFCRAATLGKDTRIGTGAALAILGPAARNTSTYTCAVRAIGGALMVCRHATAARATTSGNPQCPPRTLSSTRTLGFGSVSY